MAILYQPNSGQSDYSFLALAYSKDEIFPKLQARYSFYHNFNKGWEAELGARYTQTRTEDLYALVMGGSKYLGSFWINLRSFSTYQDASLYPVLAFRTRYYRNTRFDYWEASLGYGTSPDNTFVQNQIGERLSLESYNFGVAYQHLFLKKLLLGAKVYYNNLEYRKITGKIRPENTKSAFVCCFVFTVFLSVVRMLFYITDMGPVDRNHKSM